MVSDDVCFFMMKFKFLLPFYDSDHQEYYLLLLQGKSEQQLRTQRFYPYCGAIYIESIANCKQETCKSKTDAKHAWGCLGSEGPEEFTGLLSIPPETQDDSLLSWWLKYDTA